VAATADPTNVRTSPLGSPPSAGKSRPGPGAGEDGPKQGRRIEVALPLDHQPFAQSGPVAHPPGDATPANGASYRQLDVGALGTDPEALHLPGQVGDEREEWPGEAFRKAWWTTRVGSVEGLKEVRDRRPTPAVVTSASGRIGLGWAFQVLDQGIP
jgi:hypothetical protein